MVTRKRAAAGRLVANAKASRKAPPKASPAATTTGLLDDIRSLIDSARAHVAQTANATMTLLYWRVGSASGERC